MAAFFGARVHQSTQNNGSGASLNLKFADTEVSDPPRDSISSLAFSTAVGPGEFLAVGSWDNQVRIYEVNPADGRSQGQAMYQHQGPVLSLCWNKEGDKVLSGGADNAAWLYDLTTGQSSQVAQHDAPVNTIRWIESPQGGFLATGSWDKTLKYWDLRSSTPIATIQLPERCYSMDVRYPLLVVGTAERHIQVFNLTNPTVVYKAQSSPLKQQTRVVTCFPSADGFAVGNVEGRAAMHYVDESKSQQSYTFRCHRKEKMVNAKVEMMDVYAVNDINFHPVEGTFSTAGSDGAINFWDKDARVRLKNMSPRPFALSLLTSFDVSAISYDWSRGYIGMTPSHPNRVMLHACEDEEVKRRQSNRK